MKITVSRYHFLALALLLTPGLSASSDPSLEAKAADSETGTAQSTPDPKPAPKLVLDYKDPIHFMSDFLDVTKKPEKSLKYWAAQLIMLLKSNTRLAGFCNKIKTIALSKDMNLEQRTKNINNAFLDAYMQQLFSDELSKFIFSKGLPKVKDAIKTRAAKA